MTGVLNGKTAFPFLGKTAYSLFYIIRGVFFIALCDESYQYLISHREFEVMDLLMDVLGIATMVFILFIRIAHRAKSRELLGY